MSHLVELGVGQIGSWSKWELVELGVGQIGILSNPALEVCQDQFPGLALTARAQCYKTFCFCILRLFVIS
jgi:hypothetical protein